LASDASNEDLPWMCDRQTRPVHRPVVLRDYPNKPGSCKWQIIMYKSSHPHGTMFPTDTKPVVRRALPYKECTKPCAASIHGNGTAHLFSTDPQTNGTFSLHKMYRAARPRPFKTKRYISIVFKQCSTFAQDYRQHGRNFQQKHDSKNVVGRGLFRCP
jgi:hypothetical protein